MTAFVKHYASSDIPLHRNSSATLFSDDWRVIEKFGKDNLASFNESKTTQAACKSYGNSDSDAIAVAKKSAYGRLT